MQDIIALRQVDLLNAAFLRGPGASDAWRRWSGGVDWDGHLDPTSFALLPRVYRNLRPLGIDDPIFPRCKGIMHQAWLTNQHLLKGLCPGLDALGQAGIVPLLLPPTWVLSRDRSAVLDRARPVHWAVTAAQAEPAIRSLLGLGWSTDGVRLPRWSLAGYVAGTRHLILKPPEGPHWLLRWGLAPWLDEHAARAAAEPCDLGGRQVFVLAPRDALCFVLHHPQWTAAFGLAAELLTIADLGKIQEWPEPTPECRGALPLNWNEYLLRLDYLFAQWGSRAGCCRVPASAPVPAPAPRVNPRRRLAADWARYCAALRVQTPLAGQLLQLPGYLMGRWQLRHPLQLPRRALGWLRTG